MMMACVNVHPLRSSPPSPFPLTRAPSLTLLSSTLSLLLMLLSFSRKNLFCFHSSVSCFFIFVASSKHIFLPYIFYSYKLKHSGISKRSHRWFQMMIIATFSLPSSHTSPLFFLLTARLFQFLDDQHTHTHKNLYSLTCFSFSFLSPTLIFDHIEFKWRWWLRISFVIMMMMGGRLEGKMREREMLVLISYVGCWYKKKDYKRFQTIYCY